MNLIVGVFPRTWKRRGFHQRAISR